MKELLLQYTRYNLWANKRILSVLHQLDEASVNKQLVSSFPAIKDMVYHIWSAESIWLQRLKSEANPVWLADNYQGSFLHACSEWQKTSEGILDFTAWQPDEDKAFTHIFRFYHGKDMYDFPVFTALNHVLNHSAQHRGQLITMFREVGYTDIQSIDLCTYVTS